MSRKWKDIQVVAEQRNEDKYWEVKKKQSKKNFKKEVETKKVRCIQQSDDESHTRIKAMRRKAAKKGDLEHPENIRKKMDI